MQQNVNPHTGHRERMKKKIQEGFVGTFEDHELLETILYYVVPRGDTNKLAHDLLSSFGSLKNVLSCDSIKLKSVFGVGDAVANYLVNLGQLYRKAVLSEIKTNKIDNPLNIKNFIKSNFAFENEEKFIMICADANLKILQVITLEKGDSASTSFSVTGALKSAMLANAKFVLFAHNHIFSGSQPSVADINSTKELVQKFAFNNMIVLDHIIIGQNDDFSFRDFPTYYVWFNEINVDLKKVLEQNKIEDFKMNCSCPEKNIVEYMFLAAKRK